MDSMAAAGTSLRATKWPVRSTGSVRSSAPKEMIHGCGHAPAERPPRRVKLGRSRLHLHYGLDGRGRNILAGHKMAGPFNRKCTFIRSEGNDPWMRPRPCGTTSAPREARKIKTPPPLWTRWPRQEHPCGPQNGRSVQPEVYVHPLRRK